MNFHRWFTSFSRLKGKAVATVIARTAPSFPNSLTLNSHHELITCLHHTTKRSTPMRLCMRATEVELDRNSIGSLIRSSPPIREIPLWCRKHHILQAECTPLSMQKRMLSSLHQCRYHSSNNRCLAGSTPRGNRPNKGDNFPCFICLHNSGWLRSEEGLWTLIIDFTGTSFGPNHP